MSLSVSFDHIQLNARDVEATASFYERVFGMRRIRASEADGIPFVHLDVDGVRLSINGQAPHSAARVKMHERDAVGLRRADAAHPEDTLVESGGRLDIARVELDVVEAKAQRPVASRSGPRRWYDDPRLPNVCPVSDSRRLRR